MAAPDDEPVPPRPDRRDRADGLGDRPDDPGVAPTGLTGSARALLDAVLAISSELDLHAVLERLTQAASELTDARYAALGVIGPQGHLVDFVAHGLDAETYARIGDLPRGRGLLGLLVSHPEPVRLADLTRHPSASGFPPGHPEMKTFLGMPVRIRGSVFGNIYLTEKAGGAEFTEEDQTLVEALATAAGFVIENARAYGLSERRRRWLEATAGLTDALQPPITLTGALASITNQARATSGAVAAAVVRPSTGGKLALTARDGSSGRDVDRGFELLLGQLRGQELPGRLVEHPLGERFVAMLLPVRAHLSEAGVLALLFETHAGGRAPEDREMLTEFADQAALALDRAQALEDRRELAVISDRDRIARDLHDLVIQRLFATGLQLQGLRGMAANEEVASRIDKAVDDLDLTIRDIRNTIFALQDRGAGSLRGEIRQLVDEYTPVLGFVPVVRTVGPIDTAVPDEVRAQLVAVLREAFSNVARHAAAQRLVAEITVSDQEVVLQVDDDGRGLPPERRESGLRNARLRAVDLGGTLELGPSRPVGTRLRWRVPLD